MCTNTDLMGAIINPLSTETTVIKGEKILFTSQELYIALDLWDGRLSCIGMGLLSNLFTYGLY